LQKITPNLKGKYKIEKAAYQQDKVVIEWDIDDWKDIFNMSLNENDKIMNIKFIAHDAKSSSSCSGLHEYLNKEKTK
jgi:hypothetical protein